MGIGELKSMGPGRSDAEIWASAVKFAALVIALSVVAFGLLIGQPWAEPEYTKVVLGDDSRFSPSVSCVAYKDQFSCDWPK